jgi:hypothetical protein
MIQYPVMLTSFLSRRSPYTIALARLLRVGATADWFASDVRAGDGGRREDVLAAAAAPLCGGFGDLWRRWVAIRQVRWGVRLMVLIFSGHAVVAVCHHSDLRASFCMLI